MASTVYETEICVAGLTTATGNVTFHSRLHCACTKRCDLKWSPISYLESSFLTAHGLTKRTTLERSVRGAVLIGCSKTMQMTGSKSEIQYGGPNSTKNCLQAWTVNVCKCCNNIAFESKHPVDLYWPKVTKESILLLL